MMLKADNIRLATAAVSLLWAATPWTNAHAAGAMDDYHVQCEVHSVATVTTCAALVMRLEELEQPDRAERLALLSARWTLAGLRGEPGQPSAEDFCAGVRTLATDHPDYADALLDFALFCGGGLVESTTTDPLVALSTRLHHVLEIEPGNFRALFALLMLVHGTSGWENNDAVVEEVGPENLAGYREALYVAAKDRAAWALAAYPPNAGSRLVWQDMFAAARYLRAAAARAGDPDGAEDLRARVRRDAGLDALEFGGVVACPDRSLDCVRGSRKDSLGLACHPILYVDLGLEDICLAAVEKLAGQASADGLPLPNDVLEVVDEATEGLRRAACAESIGENPGVAALALLPHECKAEATETDAVRRLRSVLVNHSGEWSAEHHRVHAQRFLRGDYRLDGLRAALRADADNSLLRCQLATALNARGDSAGVAALGVDPDCLNRSDFDWADRH